MQPITSSPEPIRLKLAKQLFRDGWLLTLDKQEFGELRFGSLRLKASGKSAEGEYELKKDKHSATVLRDGKTIATYEGKAEGKATLADGSLVDLRTEMVSTSPGHIIERVMRADGVTILWTETTWNSFGVAKCDLIIEPEAPSGDALWGAILTLLRVVVDYSLWNVSREAAVKLYVSVELWRKGL